MNHSFRPDSPRFSATDKHASPNIGSITKAQPTTFWDTIYFYTASATVGNQSSIVPRETSHHERDGLMTTCGCLFGIVCLNKTSALERCRREKRRALSTRVESINSSAVGAHARKYKKPPSSRLQQNTKQKINKKLRCILIDKNIHHHAHHRNSGKLDDTDRAEERK